MTGSCLWNDLARIQWACTHCLRSLVAGSQQPVDRCKSSPHVSRCVYLRNHAYPSPQGVLDHLGDVGCSVDLARVICAVLGELREGFAGVGERLDIHDLQFQRGVSACCRAMQRTARDSRASAGRSFSPPPCCRGCSKFNAQGQSFGQSLGRQGFLHERLAGTRPELRGRGVNYTHCCRIDARG
jgi:hypothetical protein